MSSTNLKHPGARAAFLQRRWARSQSWHSLALVIPVLLASPRLGDGGRPGGPGAGYDRTPAPHAIDVWLEHQDGPGVDQVALRQASRAALARSPALFPALASRVVGGFTQVGSVAILEGDDTTVQRVKAGYGVDDSNLKVVATRFIQAFGDDYDQIAVFLSFRDMIYPGALAYQQPVKNDTKGLGLGYFDATKMYGSASGRMQTVLNMNRINVYGRDAAADPDNGLYAVWAQEAAHRWLVYFRFKRASDTALSDALLGRQGVHWSRGVAAEGSIQDGYSWKDNGDGTFTPGARGVRYGSLDQYGMGLRKASEVPPFFLLEDLTDMNGVVVAPGGLSRAGRYKARKVDLTIDDIIRAVGPREPETEPAAEDLRMGVMLLGAPGIPAAQLVGEAFAIDNSRRFWTDFYNEAGGGRGKVCTELNRPCRGGSFDFSEVRVTEAVAGDGVVTPGEAATLEVKITNLGEVPAPAKLRVEAGAAMQVSGAAPVTAPIPPGESVTVKMAANVTRSATCAQPVAIDLRADGAKGPSRLVTEAVFGLKPERVEGFEEAGAAAWRVNPDGTDMGQAGRWAVGTPQRSAAFGFTLQPGAAYAGSRAFATGLAAEEIDNVEGRTTLESPPFPVAGLREPVLGYRTYFVAAAFGQEVLVPATGGSFKVLASLDGGPWTPVDEMTGMGTGWEQRLVSLPARLGAAVATAKEVRLRFVAEETDTSRPVVEMAIDDVGIYSTVAACEGSGEPPPPLPPDGGMGPALPDAGGCGCRVGVAPGTAPASGASLLALAAVGALVLGLRRGRRRRAGDRG